MIQSDLLQFASDVYYAPANKPARIWQRAMQTLVYCLLPMLLTLSIASQAENNVIHIQSLEQAISRAQKVDPWRDGNRLQQQSLLARSESIVTLPDPKLTMGLQNLPTDGFAFSQEPMTQLKIGVSQSFPRGDSQQIKKQHLQRLALQHPYLEQDRMAKLTVQVSLLWLEALRAQQGADYLATQQQVFEQLVETVQSQYASGRLNTRQDDVVRAQLELSRLKDRNSVLRLERDQALTELSELLTSENELVELSINNSPRALTNLSTPDVAILSQEQRNQDMLSIRQHPAFLGLEQRVKAGFEQVKLAEQKYKPQWGVNASYAYRQDDEAGRSRADFFSVGVSLDLPLFTEKHLDNDVRAQRYQAESLKTEKRLLMRDMLSRLNQLRSRLLRNKQRLDLHEHTILPQLLEHSQATLNAYINGEGEFAKVVRARIAEFNGQLTKINIAAEQHKVASQIRYFKQTPSNASNGDQ